MRNLLFVCLLGVMLASCTEQSREPVDLWSDTVLAIPDWEATPEEKAMKEAFHEILMEKVQVEGKKLILTVDKDYFLEKGLPEEYYDKMLKGLEMTEKTRAKQNKALRKMIKDGLMDIDEDEADIYILFQQAQEEYRRTGKDKIWCHGS